MVLMVDTAPGSVIMFMLEYAKLLLPNLKLQTLNQRAYISTKMSPKIGDQQTRQLTAAPLVAGEVS